MKKISFSILLIISVLNAFSQPDNGYKLHVGISNYGLRIEGPSAMASGGKAISVGGYGDIQFDKPGIVGGRFTIKENGLVGIGTNNPANQLDVAGLNNWDMSNTEGDFRVGNATHRLKIGVALGGGGAGTVNIRAMGGINLLNIGAGSTSGISIVGNGNVGIGTTSPTAPLTFANGFGRKIAFHDAGFGDQYVLEVNQAFNGFLFMTAGTSIEVGRDISFGHGTSAGNYWERFNFKANGGFGVSNGVGSAGQILTSQGNGSPVIWKNNSNTEQYNAFAEVSQTASITATGTSQNLPGLEHTLNLSKPALVTVSVNTSTHNDGCFACLTVTSLLELEVNGTIWGTSQIQLENTTSGVYLSSGNLEYQRTFKLAAGTYTFKAKGRKGTPFGGGSTGTVYFSNDSAHPLSFSRWGYMNFNIVYQ